MSDSTICRLCANACYRFQSLYYTNGRPNGVYEIMLELFHPKFVDMEAAKHLTNICLDCFRHIYDFHSFQTTVMMAQLELVDDLTEMNVRREENCNNSKEEDLNSAIIDLSSIPLSVKEDQELCQDDKPPGLNADSHDDNITSESKSGNTDLSTSKPIEDTSQTDDNHPTNQNPKQKSNCKLCSKLYANDKGLERHLRKHHPGFLPSYFDPSYDPVKRRFQCKLCCNNFQYKRTLSFHVRLRHGKKGGNANQAGGNRFKCKLCGNSYAAGNTLRVHMNSQHPGMHPNMFCSDYDATTKRFKCKFCERTFVQHFHLVNHVKHHENKNQDGATTLLIKTGQEEERISSNQQNAYKDIPKKFKCKFCNVYFKSQVTLKKHFKRLHPNFNPNMFNPDYDAKTNSFKCNICSKSFPRKCNMVYHRKYQHTHSNRVKRKFRCNLCGNSYTHKKSLQMHETREHRAPKITIESGSDKTSPYESKLDNRVKRNFRCDPCGITYIHKKLLEMHVTREHRAPKITIESGFNKTISTYETKLDKRVNRNFRCEPCGISYIHMKSLEMHVTREHMEPKITFDIGSDKTSSFESKQLDSSKCMEEGNADSLQKSKNRHELAPFKCHICDQSYMSESALRSHIEGQHGAISSIKLHCKLCDKGFKTETFLIIHMERKHGPERSDFEYDDIVKLFKCKHCEKSYKAYSSVVDHLDQEHKHAFDESQENKSTKESLQQENHYADESVDQVNPEISSSKDEFDHTCNNCGKTCTDELSFNCHKCYTCDMCGEILETSSALSQHLNDHFKIEYTE